MLTKAFIANTSTKWMFIIMYTDLFLKVTLIKKSIPYKCCKGTSVLQYAHANVHSDYSYCEMTLCKHHKGMGILHCAHVHVYSDHLHY